MSSKGIYSALSGALAQSQRLDTIANNIANVNTPGFKRDDQTFREYLTANQKPPDLQNVPKVPASIDSFYDMQGGDVSYVDNSGTYTEFTQGSLKSTGNPLDLAIDGEGFFEVLSPQGVSFTRVGSFRLDSVGQLVTSEGHPVLLSGEPGTDPGSRTIRLAQGPIQITENGEVFDGPNPVGRLSLVKVPNPDSLGKVGNSLFRFKSNATPEVANLETASLRQGFIESSNVNIVKEMTDMISATRVFESTQKAISAYDQMADKLVNNVPKV